MSLLSNIESILFITTKPITAKKLADILKTSDSKIESEMARVMEKYNVKESGVFVLKKGKEYQMMTNPDNAKVVQAYLQDPWVSQFMSEFFSFGVEC